MVSKLHQDRAKIVTYPQEHAVHVSNGAKPSPAVVVSNADACREIFPRLFD